MRQRPVLALGAGLVAAWAMVSALAAEPALRLVDSFTWRLNEPAFGGLSGFELGPDGASLVAVSDRGTLWRGRVERQDGRIRRVSDVRYQRLTDEAGRPIDTRREDAEGLALMGDRLFVSFEGVHRVWDYSDPARAKALPAHPDFAGLINNSSLEALCVDTKGRLYTVPERSGRLNRPFPVYRFDGARWSVPFSIPRTEGFLTVGCDIAEDGWFYLLEREFTGLGFRSQVRRLRLDGSRVQTLLQTRVGQFDNLESISLWTAPTGQTMLTLLSDNNFRWFQRTQFVDFALTE